VTSLHGVTCDEMRALVSCGLDGAISQFEVALAAAHVRDCPACAAFEADVAAFTRLLRDAELEAVPRHVGLPYGIRHRRPMRVLRSAVATAAVAVAAVAIGGSVRLSEGPQVIRSAVAPPNDAISTRAPAVGTIAKNRLITLQELYRNDLSEGNLPVVAPLEDDSLGAVKPVLRAGNV
jgi:hypothetical protein